MSQETTAAKLIAAARGANTVLVPLPEHCRPQTEDDGYSVQEVLHGVFKDDLGGRRVGYKIGCTNPVMQKNLGIDQPCGGSVSNRLVHRNHLETPLTNYVKPGVECEIGVILARDLDPTDAPFDRTNITDMISAVMAAIEIVDNRYEGGPAIGVPTLIADDFYNAGAVLGEQMTEWQGIDLAALNGRVMVDSVEQDAGKGAAVMGHPLEAVAWFLNMKAARGEILKEGEFILTGTLTMVQWIDEPCTVTIEIDQLGSLGVTFT